MIQAAKNNYFIKVKSAYTKNATDILRLSAIQNQSSVFIEDFAQIVGEVVSIPCIVDMKGFSGEGIRVGDTVVIRYDVIHDFAIKPDGENYFRNLLFIKGEQLWKASIDKIFAVIRDNEIFMINGYVMLQDFQEPLIYVKASARRARKAKIGHIMQIGFPQKGLMPISAHVNDNVYFDANKTSKYRIGDKKFRIITQQNIFGKQIE